MAKFKRIVERQKKEYAFTKKQEVIITNGTLFKESLTFSWIPRKMSSLAIVFLVFLFVSFAVIPLLMQYTAPAIAMLVGHGLITSSLLVMVFYRIDSRETKPSIKELLLRFVVVAVLLAMFAAISITVL